MLENDQKYVALFIDWDNLVISTAADLGGATPDLKRIVQKAQQYGIVLLAKAYAEWQSTSDKLAVYRTGVEPVYAPTFRFETEATIRGKSLADPCMVADIVDSLHLMPLVSTYVIVTGDKDMIPVVRLGQLRGKKVVVIGPDFVAGVLRDMADEFVSYRKLVDAEPLRVAGEQIRRHQQVTQAAPGVDLGQNETATSRSNTGAGRQAAATEPSGSRTATRRTRTDARGRTIDRQVVSTTNRKEPPAEEAPATEFVVEPATAQVQTSGRNGQATTERSQPADLASVYTAITELLEQRAAEGKPRIRATNLKDVLMQRIAGFSERRYGFSKFKDLLTAAEASGMVKVRVAGPVHWVSLPDKAEDVAEQVAEQTVTEVEEPHFETEEARPPITEMIKFVQNLRERSRWLTYTYLLTNMISHFAKSLPQAAAESQARSTLNWLVQEGVLRIDKEPQEVEVAGAKHRVRMCHIEQTHDLVAALLAEMRQEAEARTAEVAASPADESPERAQSVEVAAPSNGSSEDADTGQVATEVADADSSATTATDAAAPQQAQPRHDQEESDAASEETENLVPIAPVPAANEAAIEVNDNGAKPSPEAAVEDSVLSSVDALTSVEATGSSSPVESWPASDSTSIEAEATAAEVKEAAAETDSGASDPQPVLPQVFALLADLVRTNTGPKRPRMGAAGLKVRLTKTLGGFDEHAYGFSRFKDFLIEAESQGHVRLETSGQITWVMPLGDAQSSAAPEEDGPVPNA